MNSCQIKAAAPKAAMVMSLGCFLLWMQFISFRAARGLDFEHYYTCAQMVRAGLGGGIYDPFVQYRLQAQYGHGVGPLFNYPAAAALLYWPTTFFDLLHGYLVWATISLAAVMGSLFLLNRTFDICDDFWYLALLALGFFPLHASQLEGQSDAFLLLAYVLALVALKSERPVAAGVALALGLIKFHLVLPFVFIMLLRRKWRFLSGFAAGSVMIVAMSELVSGNSLFTAYPRLLLTMQSLPYGGFHPNLMPNVRGALFLVTGREAPFWGLLVVGLTMGIWTAHRWSTLEAGFSASLVTTLLVTYHVYPADLLLLLIPLALMAKSFAWNSRTIIVFTLLAVPIVPYVCVDRGCAAFLAAPMLLLLCLLTSPAHAEVAPDRFILARHRHSVAGAAGKGNPSPNL